MTDKDIRRELDLLHSNITDLGNSLNKANRRIEELQGELKTSVNAESILTGVAAAQASRIDTLEAAWERGVKRIKELEHQQRIHAGMISANENNVGYNKNRLDMMDETTKGDKLTNSLTQVVTDNKAAIEVIISRLGLNVCHTSIGERLDILEYVDRVHGPHHDKIAEDLRKTTELVDITYKAVGENKGSLQHLFKRMANSDTRINELEIAMPLGDIRHLIYERLGKLEVASVSQFKRINGSDKRLDTLEADNCSCTACGEHYKAYPGSVHSCPKRFTSRVEVNYPVAFNELVDVMKRVANNHTLGNDLRRAAVKALAKAGVKT